MPTAMIVLNSPTQRAKAIRWLQKAPWNARITFRGPSRSLPQNDRMWVLLTHIAEQCIWDGQRHSADEWKDYFCGMMRRDKTMSAEDGGQPIVVGRSTSSMDKEEHSELTMLIEAFAARQGVVIPEPEEAEA